MIRLVSIIAATFLLIACSYLPGYTQALPWKTIDELKADVVNAEPAMCSGAVSAPGMMFRLAVTHDGVNYLLFMVPAREGQTVALMVGAQLDQDGHPVRIYHAKLDEAAKTLVTVESHPFNSDKDQGPCQELFPQTSN
jgi:hypothetical protein